MWKNTKKIFTGLQKKEDEKRPTKETYTRKKIHVCVFREWGGYDE